MTQYNGNYTDEDGRPVKGASVFIYTSEGVLAEITDTNDNPVSQPLLTDEDGNYSYRADDGYYRHVVWVGKRRVLRENEIILGPSYRDQSQSAAQVALAAAGVGQYANTALGLAGTDLGETFWVDQGDGTGQVYRHDVGPVATPLQSFLLDPQASGASKLIGSPFGKVEGAVIGVANLRQYGADANGALDGIGSTDVMDAVAAAKLDGFTVFRLPWVPNESNIAYFETFDWLTELLDCRLEIGEGISLSLPSGNIVGAPQSERVAFPTAPWMYFRDINTWYRPDPNGAEVVAGQGRRVMPYIDPDDADVSEAIPVLSSSLTYRKFQWGTDNIEAGAVSSSTDESFTFTRDPADGYIHAGMMPLEVDEEVEAAFSANSEGALVLACIYTTKGHIGIWCNANYSAAPVTFRKFQGEAAANSVVSALGIGTHETYSAMGAVWTIRIESRDSFSILLNGHNVGPRTPVEGVILEAGFGMYPVSNGHSVTVHDMTLIRGRKRRGGEAVAIIFYTDSRGSQRLDAMPLWFKQVLDLSGGLRCYRVTMRGVAGHSTADQLAVITADEASGLLGQHNGVVFDTITNDVQGQVDFADFSTDYAAALDIAKGSGRAVVASIPALWIGQAQSGGVGQATQNYGKGARYRARAQRIIAEKGVKLVNDMLYDGPFVGNYFTDTLGLDLTNAGDRVMPDIIHPGSETAKRRAIARAEAMAGIFRGRRATFFTPRHEPDGAFENGWEEGVAAPSIMVDDAGNVHFSIYVAKGGAPTLADGTSTYQLPRNFWPLENISVVPFADDPTDDLRAILSPAGQLLVYGATGSTSTYFAVRPLVYNISRRGAAR